MKKITTFAAAVATFATFATTTFAAPTFYFTAIPDENSDRLEERFGGIAKYLESKLDVTVKYIPVKSYSASVSAFKNNRVQLAWFGGLSGVKARVAVPGSTAIAQGAEDVQFKSYIIAHTSLGLEKSSTLTEKIRMLPGAMQCARGQCIAPGSSATAMHCSRAVATRFVYHSLPPHAGHTWACRGRPQHHGTMP